MVYIHTYLFVNLFICLLISYYLTTWFYHDVWLLKTCAHVHVHLSKAARYNFLRQLLPTNRVSRSFCRGWVRTDGCCVLLNVILLLISNRTQGYPKSCCFKSQHVLAVHEFQLSKFRTGAKQSPNQANQTKSQWLTSCWQLQQLGFPWPVGVDFELHKDSHGRRISVGLRRGFPVPWLRWAKPRV